MKKSNSIFYWFVLFAFCFISYLQIIDTIRSQYSGDSMTIKSLLGIAPNFFPAIGILALFIVIIPQMQWTNKWLNEKKHITANLISLAGLLYWEFIQAGSEKLHFDWHDILWTFIGGFVFHGIWSITSDRYKEKY